MRPSTAVAFLAPAGFAQAATLGRAQASPRAALSSQQLCAEGSGAVNEGGNWFCKAVSQIVYTNVETPAGSYNDVVHMDTNTGACQKVAKPVSGGLAPFDEPLSIHIRGPFELKQVAVYTPSTKTKRESVDSVVAKRHGHKHARYQHAHPHEAPHKVEEKREHPTVWVTATINGAVVSWTNAYWGPEATPDTPAPAAASPAANTEAAAAPAAAPAANTEPAAATPAPAASTAAAAAKPSASVAGNQAAVFNKPTPSPAAAGGDFVRSAYYSAGGSASGLTFLANYGGVAGSGAWSPTFGNTLSYVDATGTTGSSSPQTLSNVTIHSAHEISIFSDAPCDESCGYVQPGSVAYKGFGDGSVDKTFLFEFSMPHEDKNGFMADQPALWFLNSKIPRTQQYGGCSCWPSCGEFDVFETLANGDDKCKSTFHATFSAGDSNYFDRPVDDTVKVAVVFDSATQSVSVKVIDKGTVFGESLSAGDVSGFLDADGGSSSGKGASMFAIAS